MKLHISRRQEETGEQRKPIVFHLSCRVELTSEEKRLISLYNLDMSLESFGDQVGNPNLARLTEGIQYKNNDMTWASVIERDIIDTCRKFKRNLNSLVAFTGEETMEF
jgi:hypothetical protein